MVGGLAYRLRGTASWKPPASYGSLEEASLGWPGPRRAEKMSSAVGPCLRFIVHVDLKLSDFQASSGDWPTELSRMARCCLAALWRAHGAYYRCSISCAFRGEEENPGPVVTLFRQFANHFAGKAATEHQLLTTLHDVITGGQQNGPSGRPGKRAFCVQRPGSEEDDLWSLLGVRNSEERVAELLIQSDSAGDTNEVWRSLVLGEGTLLIFAVFGPKIFISKPSTRKLRKLPVQLNYYELARQFDFEAQAAGMAYVAPPTSPTGRAAEVETEIEDNGAADDDDDEEAVVLPADEVDEELVQADAIEAIERATPSESSSAARTADYMVPEQSKEVWKHFGCDTEAGRMLRKLYKGAGSRELGSKVSYPQLATPVKRWEPPPKAKPAAPKAVVRVPRAVAPRRDMDDPRQWPAPPIPCRRPAREILAELEAEEARRRRTQPDLPKGKDLDNEKQNLQDRFRYCGGRMLPKGSMGYVEPGSVPPIGGASEAAARREDRRRYDENGFDGEQREIFEELVGAVQRKQARIAQIDDEQLSDPRPSKAKTARNKEALELRNGIERDLKDLETLMSLAEGQANKAVSP
ncbi:unnamed protein product [Symbiodinium natans]|uniref:Uncharacterized protein n=1 Tax=Symbiodinium natans TaxID=878477 RepID=A0A812I668_9DINO|nr:unnamed protein product [Symbiodinium natans]